MNNTGEKINAKIFPSTAFSGIARILFSAEGNLSGGVQKMYFCMGKPGAAALQKYSFCAPGQS